MRNLAKEFQNKTIDYEKLVKYGFSKQKGIYYYEINICDNRFKVVVEISKNRQISKVIDLVMDDEYVLVDVQSSGAFVSKVRDEYNKILNDIIINCSVPNVFKSEQTKQIIEYVKEKYNDDLEYLWEKFPNNAIWRNKSNNKWYAVLLVLSLRKLGIQSDEVVDIIDLRYQKSSIKEIVDQKRVFQGYHMNKDNWITIKLDGSVDINYIYELIDNSFELSNRK